MNFKNVVNLKTKYDLPVSNICRSPTVFPTTDNTDVVWVQCLKFLARPRSSQVRLEQNVLGLQRRWDLFSTSSYTCKKYRNLKTMLPKR